MTQHLLKLSKAHGVSTLYTMLVFLESSKLWNQAVSVKSAFTTRNAALVQTFAWTSLYKNHTINKNFKNKLWEGYSIEFKYMKKHMLRPKPQNHCFSETTKNRDLITKMQNTAKNRKITKKAISVNESDSEDSDYEYDIPLMHIKVGVILHPSGRELDPGFAKIKC